MWYRACAWYRVESVSEAEPDNVRGYLYVGRVSKDITGSIFLHVVLDNEIVELDAEDDSKNVFVTFFTKVDLEGLDVLAD